MVLDRTLKMGMVGGGPGAFIGEVHRKASRLDGGVELVGGAFDIDPRKSKQMAKDLILDKKRCYGTYKELIEKELQLPEGERMDFVAVCTPNNWHYPIARALLEAGFHVMCEKPMTLTVAEARSLVEIVKKTKCVFGLMHNYTGYPMVKLARDMVRGGRLGAVRKIVVKYPQGWLATAIEKTGQMQASWRTDPKQSGGSGCGGDIGTHAENLAEYIAGLQIQEMCADLTSFVKGRKLDDDVNCLLKFNKGVKGVLHASQISVGEENNLAISVHCETGSIEWHQEHPNYLYVREMGQPEHVYKRGNDYVGAISAAAARGTRLPSGHPEAFLEAFANNYVNFTDTIRCKIARVKPDPLMDDFPKVTDGLRGMLFLDTLITSAKSKQKWTKFKK
ncbi:MAG: Gfo/Idh/MocA family oxidoreductase [Phycisphaerae bacterium]|nr:Gfo/Idh/MocA family oxidoreductase [Phycisphaerae bacterium]